jgi:myo-inositol 2-dehydrogenase/D-chiro-inositol 1-dehydrogenase
MTAKAKEMGVEIQFEDASGDIGKQLNQIQNFITQGMDAIIINPVDTTATPRMTKLGDVDTSVVTIRMNSGALCQIDSSRRTGYGYDERIEVFGSKGMIESRRQRSRGVSRYTGDKVIEDGLHAGWFERIEQSYYRALEAFAEAIAKGAAPSPSLEDGLRAQLLADKATESLKTGRSVRIAS